MSFLSRLLKRNGNLAGVDVGSSSVKVVRLKRLGKEIAVDSAVLAEFEGPGPDAVSQAMNRVAGVARLEGASIAIAVSDRSLVMRPLVLPKMPADELSEAVRWEARRQVPYDLGDAIIDYVVTGETLEGTAARYDVLLVAVEGRGVREAMAAVERSRGRVKVVDVNPLALRNTLRMTRSDEGTVVYVDIGGQRTEVNLFKQGRLRLTRSVDTGGEHCTRAFADAARVSAAEAEALKRDKGLLAFPSGSPEMEGAAAPIDRIILEVQRSIDYYRAQTRDREIQRVLLAGGGALLPGLKEHAAQFFDSPVEIDDPFAKVKGNGPGLVSVRSMAPRFSVAMGLALREAAG
ncbi:MAG: hypothetical protein A2V83_07545 [Nitrospirae bacterium RBG_16_64_22]|nr:MAG: hypothetical protein A2V83_07545 [Nitrospirae bacterium RBG_16_64_22]